MPSNYTEAAAQSPNAEMAKTLAMLSMILGIITLIPAYFMVVRAMERDEPEAVAARQTVSVMTGAVVLLTGFFAIVLLG